MILHDDQSGRPPYRQLAGDRVEVRNLEVVALCGVLPHEREHAQPFRFDVDLYLDLQPAGAADDLDLTVNYGAVIDQITASLGDTSFLLLEAMAQHVAEIALSFERVAAVTVQAHKLRPPVAAHVASTGVRIHRENRRPKPEIFDV